MNIREEQCNKVCRILDDVLANRTTERNSLIVAVRKAFESLEQFGNAEQLPSAQPQHNVRFSDADHVWIDGKQYISLQRFGKAIKDAQPETIRCKDCEWWTKQKDSLQGRCALMQMYPTGGWFCANARRKER